jgi:hypothetical protein
MNGRFQNFGIHRQKDVKDVCGICQQQQQQQQHMMVNLKCRK